MRKRPSAKGLALGLAEHPLLPCLRAMPATLPEPRINIPGDQLWPFCMIGIHDTSDQKPFLNLGDSDRWEINCTLGLIAPAGRGCCRGMNSFPALRRYQTGSGPSWLHPIFFFSFFFSVRLQNVPVPGGQWVHGWAQPPPRCG